MEDAGAGGAWRVWLGVRSGWGVSNLCQPPRKAILAFSGGFGNLPRQDCHPAGRARSWGPRRASHNPDIHSGLLGAGSVRIWAQSYVVPTGLLEGVVPSQRRTGASRAPTSGPISPTTRAASVSGAAGRVSAPRRAPQHPHPGAHVCSACARGGGVLAGRPRPVGGAAACRARVSSDDDVDCPRCQGGFS